MKKKINIGFNEEDIAKALLTRFKDPNDLPLAEFIVGALIDGDRGVETLTRWLLTNKEEVLKFEIGDSILWDPASFPSYKGDMTATTSDSRCSIQGYMRGTIIKVQKYYKYTYTISFNYIDNKGEFVEKESYVLDESSIYKIDDGIIEE